jgi:hypothetical protein
MKCGILVIGSLLWDRETLGRKDWRDKRLDLVQKISVKAPIYYGRNSNSRGKTYTMTFRADGPFGKAILVPCRAEIETIDDLLAEAGALWKAEAPKSALETIGSGWGCVGVLFGNDKARGLFAAGWADHFQRKGMKGLSVIKPDGNLDIAWPTSLENAPMDIDIILATATTPSVVPPTANTVADAWIEQSGNYERYFLENVRHGIRTTTDLEIWNRIENAAPRWLKTDAYSLAVKMLRGEAQNAEAD